MATSRAQFDGGGGTGNVKPSSGTTLRTGRGVLPKYTPKPASPATSAPQTQIYSKPAPVTRQPDYSSNYSGPGPTEALYGGAGEGAPTAAPMSDEDYLSGDASFLAQMAALQAALGNFEADSNNRKSRYGTDFDESMVNLGWQSKDNPDTVDVDESNSWNWNDTNYAAGRARQNTENDFASRGMMQSSLFGEATNNLERSLNDQRGGMVKAKTGFEQDLASQLGSYKAENKLSGSQARAEALQRRANNIAI